MGENKRSSRLATDQRSTKIEVLRKKMSSSTVFTSGSFGMDGRSGPALRVCLTDCQHMTFEY
ncbi:hypothetical protein LINGRAHAP2_LOCUS11441 [Linum grandiflorum]